MTHVNVNQDKVSLYKKIIKVMAQVKGIPKNGFNKFHGYAFVQEADLTEHIRKFMIEEGLVLFNSMREYEIVGDIAVVTYDFTLCDVDTGESVTSCIVAEGMDKGDKKFFKALTGATKYYLMKTFLVPSGIDPEVDATTDQQSYGGQQQSQQQSQQPTNKPQGNGQAAKPKKPISEKQLKLINDRIEEITLLVDQDEDALVQSLKERVGDFGNLEDMSSFQASKCIEHLTKWKSSYSNRK